MASDIAMRKGTVPVKGRVLDEEPEGLQLNAMYLCRRPCRHDLEP